LGVGLIEPLDDIRAETAEQPRSFEPPHAGIHRKRIQYEAHFAPDLPVADLSAFPDHSPVERRRQGQFSHAMARRLPAEVLLDSIYRITGSTEFPWRQTRNARGTTAGFGHRFASGFLATLGRPARERLRMRTEQ
jgi:hypothetical protein